MHDWSNADIVFTDSVMFSPETMRQISERAKALKKGARIVSYKAIQGDSFRFVDNIPVQASWLSADSHLNLSVFEKVTEPEKLQHGSLVSTVRERTCCISAKCVEIPGALEDRGRRRR